MHSAYFNRKGCSVSFPELDGRTAVLVDKCSDAIFIALKSLMRVGRIQEITFELKEELPEDLKVSFLEEVREEIMEDFNGVEDFDVTILGVFRIANLKHKEKGEGGNSSKVLLVILDLESLEKGVLPVKASALVSERGSLIFDTVFF